VPARSSRRLDRLRPGRQLLAEAGDHQQGVVHPQGEPDHRADGEGEGVDREPRGEEVEDAARGEHGDRAEDERDQRRDRRAEDEQQDDEEDRQRDQLAVLGRVDGFLLQRSRQGRVAGLGRRHRRLHVFFQDPFELGDGLVDRGFRVDVEVGEDQRRFRFRAQPCDRPLVPRRQGRHPRFGAQRFDQSRPLFFDRRFRALEQDREGGRRAEVFFQQFVGFGRGAAGDVQRGRVEALGDPRADDRQRREDERGDQQDLARMPQQPRLPPRRSRARGPVVPPAPAASHPW